VAFDWRHAGGETFGETSSEERQMKHWADDFEAPPLSVNRVLLVLFEDLSQRVVHVSDDEDIENKIKALYREFPEEIIEILEATRDVKGN
jgi:hypothetical protein